MKIVVALAALAAATALAAQTLGDPRAQLTAAQAQAEGARQRAAQLETQAQAQASQADRARAAQAAAAARIQAAEADTAAAEAQLALIDRLQRAQERRLAARQQPIVELVAALQTMARRPTAAVLVQPGSLDDLVHVRALLSTMAPQVAAQTKDLRDEVARIRGLRLKAAGALADLREAKARHAAEQQQLARLEASQRRQSARFANAARLEAERAATLGANSRELEQLVRTLDREAALRARLESLPGPLPRPDRLSDALPPASPAAQARRFAYRLPVLGSITRGYGERLASGARSSGVAIAARPGAIVVAPAAGRISFAGLYRGYGAIAILDHGDGYVSLITGLAANLARVGDTVMAGSPIGRSGDAPIGIELRKDGEPVNLSQFVA